MDDDPASSDRLLARAAAPELRPLWHELGRRLGASARPVRRVRLRGLDDGQRDALADLLGLAHRPEPDPTVTVAHVADALRLDDDGLRRLVARLEGPIDDRAARRDRAREARRRLWADVDAAVDGRGLTPWVARLRAAGVPDGDVDAHRRRLAPVLALVAALPLHPAQPLAVVAQRYLGDPHALDSGTWAGAAVAEAAAVLSGRPAPSNAQATRDALATVGLLTDALSAPVLTVGLRGPGASPHPSWLAAMANAGEPVTLTASQLRRWPLTEPATDVHVVENPTVVAAVAGAAIPRPVVCTASWPTQAGVLVLDQLRAAGARLHYHGDIDPTGLVLAEHHRTRFGASPWRLTADDYLDAVPDATVPIAAEVSVPPTPWDPTLADAVRAHRRVVFEEQVMAVLLDDLRLWTA